MNFRDAVSHLVGFDPSETDDMLLGELVARLSIIGRDNRPRCPQCGRPSSRNGSNAAGGHRYRCAGCKKVFIHGGPGKGQPLPAGKAVELVRLVDEGSSIRAACAELGVAKSTGRKAVKRVAGIRHDQIMKGNYHADGN